MFSSMASSTLPPRPQPSSTSKPYGLHIPRTFSVNVFKGSPPSSYSYATPSKHSSNSRSSPPQSGTREGSMRYTSRSESSVKTHAAASSEPHRPHYTSNPPPTTRAYEPNQPRTSPSFSIYPSTSVKGVYVYEPSLKSEIYSDSEADTSLPPSPTDSSDSTETFKSPLLSELALEDDKPQDSSSTPSTTTSRNPFPLHIPALSQATSALKGVFQNAPPEASKTLPSTSLPPHGGSSRSTALNDDRVQLPAGQGRLTPASRPLANAAVYGDVNATSSMMAGPPPGPPYAVPVYADSLTSDCEANDIDPLARHNTALNSLPSGHLYLGNAASSSSTIPIPTSDLQQDRRVSPEMSTADAGSRRGYGDLPFRSSPEQDSILAQGSRDAVSHPSEASGYSAGQEHPSESLSRSNSSNVRFGRSDTSPTPSSSAAFQSSNAPSTSNAPPPVGLSRQPSSSAVAADYSPPGSNKSGERRSDRPLPAPSSTSPQRGTRGGSSPPRATYSPPGGLSEYFHGPGAASRNSPPRRRTSVDPSPYPLPPHGPARYQELPPTDSPPLLSRPYEPQMMSSVERPMEGYSRPRKESLSRSRPVYASDGRDRDYERVPVSGYELPRRQIVSPRTLII
ncbi:hypothetical protein BDN72DRAFT_525734 [Pluteus cervinus]|uniref:Uncharacterized protein n=1 Tax=Pluteus cervinus TaxID=181527 RepID=A0ACD3AXJ6_9AGAR|nr:hypothetical protein BDN72DRAFT_525734 [Pluteus cervinus]